MNMEYEENQVSEASSSDNDHSREPWHDEAMPSEFAAAAAAEEQYEMPRGKGVNRSTIILLAACLLGVGGIYMFGLKQKPKEASAKEKEVETRVDTVLAKLVNSDKKTQVSQMFRDTEDMVQAFYDYPSKQHVSVEELKRNPFSRLLANDSEATTVDEAKMRLERLRKELTQQAQELQLQTVLQGANGAQCLISGEVYCEGELVNNTFKVGKISKDSVILAAEGMEFIIRL